MCLMSLDALAHADQRGAGPRVGGGDGVVAKGHNSGTMKGEDDHASLMSLSLPSIHRHHHSDNSYLPGGLTIFIFAEA
jgi:hypothetical protein